MAGQLWSVPAEGGYLYSDELSDILRTQVEPLTKFRQLADAKDGASKGLHAGETFVWNTYSKIGRQGRTLLETDTMPENGFTIVQRSLTVTEAGQAVPYTGKLEYLGKHDVVEIIDHVLKHDARKFFDVSAFNQFNLAPIQYVADDANPANGNLTVNATPSGNNNQELTKIFVKYLVDLMKERNIPPYVMDDFVAIAHPSTWRPLKDDLEPVYQYTETGINHIFNGEIGRYESTRYVEQNNIAKGNFASADAVFDGTATAWGSGNSWAFFMGSDTVTEAIVVPEEIRAKVPGDYGRSKGIAWYYLGGFGLVHGTDNSAVNARILKWASAA